MRNQKDNPHGRTAALVNGLGLLAFALGAAVRLALGESGPRDVREAVGMVSFCAYAVLCVWSWAILRHATRDTWAKVTGFLLPFEVLLALVGLRLLLGP
jgi:protein-S-isoprenylcysteine O-methyltransferase Ste14